MIPDKLDLFILGEIYEAHQKKKDCNNWELAQKYATQCNEKDIDKVYKRIKERLKKYCCHGIFFESKNGDGKIIYNMDLNMINFVKKSCADGMQRGLWIRI